MKTTLGLLTAVVASLPLLSQPVLAHVIWFENQGNSYELIFGHPELNDPEPLTLSKFKEATAYDSNKNTIPTTVDFINDELLVTPQGQAAALTAFYDNGYWLENPDGSFTNLTEEEAAAIDFVNKNNFVKYTKFLAEWSDTLSEPFDLPLEIQPLTNPIGLKSGDQLPIQVLLNGNIVLNPTVEYLGQTLPLDASGIALIPIGKGGLQVIEASYQNPAIVNPGISYATTLSVQPTAVVPEPSLVLALGTLGISFLLENHVTDSAF